MYLKQQLLLYGSDSNSNTYQLHKRMTKPTMEQSIKIIKSVEQTHKGLGIPVLFTFLTVLARKGIFLIASRGNGKGATISCINQFDKNPQYKVSIFESVNYTDFKKQLHGRVFKKTLLWKIPEYSTLSKYNRSIFLPMISQLISDHRYVKNITETFFIDIQESYCVGLIGIQPLKMQRMMIEDDTMESLVTDRFIKFILINPLRSEDDYYEGHPKFTVPLAEILKRRDKIKPETSFKQTKNLFRMQVSIGRTKQFAIEYMKAFCMLEGYDIITPEIESQFISMFSPYLRLYDAVTYSRNIDESDTTSTGALRMIELMARSEDPKQLEFTRFTAKELAKIFKVYSRHEDENQEVDTSTINYHLRILKHSNIIQNKKEGQVPYYSLSQNLQDYFHYYKENWSK
jgi:hypothetical protein